MKRFVPTLMLVVGLSLSAAVPALANNDPRVPADNCSGNPIVVGQPLPPPLGLAPNTNATNIVEAIGQGDNPVDGAASASNPGVSTGALGQLNSEAIGHCAATTP